METESIVHNPNLAIPPPPGSLSLSLSVGVAKTPVCKPRGWQGKIVSSLPTSVVIKSSLRV